MEGREVRRGEGKKEKDERLCDCNMTNTALLNYYCMSAHPRALL